MRNPNNIRFIGGFICASTSIDQNTNVLSAFNMIDQIDVNATRKDASKPMTDEPINIPLSFQVVTIWKRTKVEDLGKDVSSKIQIALIDGQQKTLSSHVVEFKLEATKIRTRNILNVPMMSVTQSGEYCFEFRSVAESGEVSEPLAKLCLDVVVNRA